MQVPLSIAFAFVATHNHFMLDRGGRVFKQSAPVIKLPEGTSEEDHLALLGPLNSSTGCFWGRQVFFPKGGFPEGRWQERLEWDGTKLQQFPFPANPPLDLATEIDACAEGLSAVSPESALRGQPPNRHWLDRAHREWMRLRRRMIALQEELDWRCYRLYGLIDDDVTLPMEAVPEIALGERSFEIDLARRMAAGETETRWFERHHSTPITELPDHWSGDYRALVERRLAAIAGNKAVRLIERPEYKRRWHTESWEAMTQAALRSWLLDRLESNGGWSDVQLASAGQVADRMIGDVDFEAAVGLYAGDDADPGRVVADLFAEESVPYLAALRFTPTGMEKREVWERTWDLQRAEDAIDALVGLPEDDPRHLTRERAEQRKRSEVGPIDVPPKYKQGDFRASSYWRQRGKLDVPKERFVSYPDAAAAGSTLYGWAGWAHAKRAQALAARIVTAQETEGLAAERLEPLLAGLVELLPWLRQWHGEIDPQYGMPLSDFYETMLEERARSIDTTRADLAAWRPAAPVRGRRRKVPA